MSAVTPEAIETHLNLWPGLHGGGATLINLSENHTYRIDGPDSARYILRVHRPGYQDLPAIRSELAWLAALAEDTDIPVPAPFVGKNGETIQTLDKSGTRRHGVLFAFEQGEEPQESGNLKPLFRELGGFAAKCHAHVSNWTPPDGFTRPVWDTSAILDPDGLWGDWRLAPNLNPAAQTLLEKLDTRLRQDLSAFGQSADRFGLIHADMRLANLLVGGPKGTILIDFDDSGFGWHMYDFGAAVSFIEDRTDLPELAASWCEGYRSVRSLGEEHVGRLGTMVMLRRMALLAWIGSHHETELAQSLAPGFAPGTAALADRYFMGKLL